MNDNNTRITCTATQFEHNGKDVLYKSSTDLIFHIDKITQIPAENALTQKIGIISGILLSIILMLLLIILLILFICKNKRTRSGPFNSQVADETAGDPHPSVNKPIWTTNQGASRNENYVVEESHSDPAHKEDLKPFKESLEGKRSSK